MFNFYGASRRLAKQLRDALKERNQWKDRALGLEKKLDARSDFFIEREMKLVDRFLTSQAKTFAITDEIKAQQITETDVTNAALEDFLQEKREFLVQCAKEADYPNPERAAADTFKQEYPNYILEFESQ